MPRNWEVNIIAYTKRWNKEDMENFLNYLTERIGEEDTLEIIKNVSYFGSLRYESFRKRISLYEKYVGIEEVTNRLRKSLSGFERGKVENIDKVIEYLTGKDIGLSLADIKNIMTKIPRVSPEPILKK